MLCLQAMGRDTEVHVCKGSEFAFGVKSSGRSYDAVRAQIVEQDMRIKCARSAHEDSSIYIYIYSPNKGGTTEGGFLLPLYRIAFGFQDFQEVSAHLPRLA